MEEFKAGKINKYILNSKILERDNVLNVLLLLDFIMKMLRNVEKSFILKVVVVKRRFSQ